MQRKDRLIQPLEQVEPFRGDKRSNHPSIIRLPAAGDQAALGKAIEQPRDIRIAREHPLGDLPAGKSGLARAAEDAEGIVLRGRQAGRLEEFFKPAAQQIGAAEDIQECFLLTSRFHSNPR